MTTFEQALHLRRKTLQNPYAFAEEVIEITSIKQAHKKFENPLGLSDELDSISRTVTTFDGLPVLSQTATKSRPIKPKSYKDLEGVVKNIHNQIWIKHKAQRSNQKAIDPLNLLDPTIALQMLGYEVVVHGALGQIESSDRLVTNVAGIIDRVQKRVLLSSGLSPVSRRFTAAHELGHAVLHDGLGMHRDRPLDGAQSQRDPIENEADRFAALFLMPEKLVRNIFASMFGQSPFSLDEDRYFALSPSMPRQGWQPRTRRELARVLSSANRYNGTSLRSIADQFGVSTEAMAIRLEQLRLV
jgi:Zn-dependent peptidase ImmA (M78 family)